jgi:hypothetical protein
MYNKFCLGFKMGVTGISHGDFQLGARMYDVIYKKNGRDLDVKVNASTTYE